MPPDPIAAPTPAPVLCCGAIVEVVTVKTSAAGVSTTTQCRRCGKTATQHVDAPVQP